MAEHLGPSSSCVKPESRQADKMWNSWRGQEGKFQTNIRTCGGSRVVVVVVVVGGLLNRFHVPGPPKRKHTYFCWRDFFFPQPEQLHVSLFLWMRVCVWFLFLTSQISRSPLFWLVINLPNSAQLKLHWLYTISNFFCSGPHKTPHEDPCGATDPTVMGLNFSEHMHMPSNTLWCTLKHTFLFVPPPPFSRLST